MLGENERAMGFKKINILAASQNIYGSARNNDGGIFLLQEHFKGAVIIYSGGGPVNMVRRLRFHFGRQFREGQIFLGLHLAEGHKLGLTYKGGGHDFGVVILGGATIFVHSSWK